MRVMKFGGSSLATSGRIRAAGALIARAAQEGRVVVVCSAVAGVTNLLLGLASHVPPDRAGKGTPLLPGGPQEVRRRHEGLWRALFPAREEGGPAPPLEELFQELEALHEEARQRGEWSPPARDHLVGFGERLSCRLVTAYLEELGLPAHFADGAHVIRTDSTFGEARVEMEETTRLLNRLLARLPSGAIPVVTGFTGADSHGRRTTLGRGSSDYSAALVGAALRARVVEIWTDVDGVHQEDPAKLPGTPVLPRLSYQEARALAAAGAKVLHPRTLDPLEPLGIPLHVRNTFRPESSGTVVGPQPDSARPVHLYLAGATGKVGSALLSQLAALGPSLGEEEGFELLVAGAFTGRSQLWSREGIPPRQLLSLLGNGPAPDWGAIPGLMAAAGHPAPLFVDCTASPEVAGRYLEILEAGIPVVTPNKLAASGPLPLFLGLREAARRSRVPFRYETTVGAALPLLGTLRDLVRGGDQIRAITGVLSGTLSFLFARLQAGVPFSQAVREARDRGLTEPHPGEDLTGADVARKLVILLRESGRGVELSDVRVESLVPADLCLEGDPEAFLARLEAVDGMWAARVEEARGRGEELAYVGCLEGATPSAGVRSFPADHPLFHLLPGENRVVLETERYGSVPLTIAGPGAGPEITASGVLADLLAAVRELPGTGEAGGPVEKPAPTRPGAAGRRVA